MLSSVDAMRRGRMTIQSEGYFVCIFSTTTTKEPRTKEGHIKVDIDTKFELKQVNWWS